jgi:DNA-binding winged helix-turn-helix (wHTH) protein/Tol biopolymer transport system component
MEHSDRADATIRFGIFEVDPRSGELRKSGTRIRLQEQPFQLLLVLLERPGELVTRDELKRRIWPEDSFGDFDHAVNVAVAKLRAALGDSADVPRYVETLHRRGYRFVLPASAVGGTQKGGMTEPGEIPSPQKPPDSPLVTNSKFKVRWRKAALLACVAVLLGLAAVYHYSHRPKISTRMPKITQISEWHKPMNDAKLSPDGHAIAFDSPVDGISQVFVMLISGGAPLQLTNDVGDKLVNTFSPDGSEIYYELTLGPDEAWAVPTLGGPARRLVPANYLATSPDGAFLYYAKSDSLALFRADRSGLNEVKVYQSDDPHRWTSPVLVFPDGHQLLAASYRRDLPNARLSIINLATKKAMDLGVTVDVGELSGNPDVVWSEPGKSILFSRTVNGLTNIWSYNLRDHLLTQITSGIGPDYSPMLAPGGKGIYYVNGRNSGFLTAYSLDSKESLEITAEDATQPVISPDGKRVIYATLPAQQRSEIWVSDIDGNHKVKLVTSHDLVTGYWAVDNFHLSFIDYGDGSGSKVYTVAADGNDLRQLPIVDGTPTSLVWSPDQKSVYISSDSSMDESRSVWKVSLDGSTSEKIVSDCADVIDAAPSGRYLLGIVFFGQKSGVYEVSVADKKCIPLLPGVFTQGGAFAPDGNSFIYAVPSRDEAVIYRQRWHDGKLIGQPQVALTLPFVFPMNHSGNGYDISRDLSTIVYIRPGGHAELYLASPN